MKLILQFLWARVSLDWRAVSIYIVAGLTIICESVTLLDILFDLTDSSDPPPIEMVTFCDGAVPWPLIRI